MLSIIHESTVPDLKDSPGKVKIALRIRKTIFPQSKNSRNRPILLITQLLISVFFLPKVSAITLDGISVIKPTIQKMDKNRLISA